MRIFIYVCMCILYAHAIQISLVPLPVPQDDISVSCLLATSRDLHTHKPFFHTSLVPFFLPSSSSTFRPSVVFYTSPSVFVTTTLYSLRFFFFLTWLSYRQHEYIEVTAWAELEYIRELDRAEGIVFYIKGSSG